jgi:hypothetical protein
LLTEETKTKAKQEQNEVNDSALAADLKRLNRNNPGVRQHNGKGCSCYPYMPTGPRIDKKRFLFLSDTKFIPYVAYVAVLSVLLVGVWGNGRHANRAPNNGIE